MANRYLVPGGTGDFNSSTNWSTISGGTSGASVPTAADAIIIDTNSANTPLTVSTPNSCLSITCSNYTGPLTLNNNLMVVGTTNTGNITFSTGMTLTGTGTLIKTPTGTNGTITFNGVAIDCDFAFQPTVNNTTTFSGVAVFNKKLSFTTVSSTILTTVNTPSGISVGGDLTLNHKASFSTTLTFAGANDATIYQTPTSILSANLYFNKTGILNISDLYMPTSVKSITHAGGVVIHTGTLYLLTSCQFYTAGMTWNIINTSGTNISCQQVLNADTITKTGNSALSISGTNPFVINNFNFVANNSYNLIFIGGLTYTINKSINISSSSNLLIMKSSSLTVNAKIVLGTNAFMKLYRINMTNIDASLGKQLKVVVGVINNCINCSKISSI